MINSNNMNKFAIRSILFSITLLFSIILILIPSNVYAEEINVKSISLEETIILEVTNSSNKEIDALRIWLAKDFNFQSFKTEEGWIGEKTPQGVIIFTSSEPIKSGEIVKFGIKTDKLSSGVNWKVLDKDANQIGIGKTLPKELPDVIQNPNIISAQIDENDNSSMFSESTFKIIPEKPSPGSTIRVIGDKFQPSQTFDFYIDTEKIGNFSTDVNGHFITTMKIPEQKSDRIEFKITNNDNQVNKMSIRLGENITVSPGLQNHNLTLIEIPHIMYRGDNLEISGTGKANHTITIEFGMLGKDPISSKISKVSNEGIWKLNEPIIIALDAEFGKYAIKVSDGIENIMKQWNIESNKNIMVEASSLKYEVGSKIKLNGKVLPNNTLEISLEDSLGKEITSDIIQIDSSGSMEFEYTLNQTAVKGTYKITLTQGGETEFIFIGIGQLPKIPIDLKFNKVNYNSNEIAIISLMGEPDQIINLLIIDPSNNQKGESKSIQLRGDGKNTHEINLTEYTSGIYTAVINTGGAESIQSFTVGLQTGSGDINIQTTKNKYLPGDPILILGNTSENTVLEIIMIDSNETKIKTKETFSNKDGKFSDSSFRIPNDAKPGIWKIGAKSGSNFDQVEIEVLSKEKEGIQLSVEEGIEVGGIGKTIQLIISGVYGSVEIKIISNDNVVLDELSFVASESGEINVPWIIPKDVPPGIYTVIVNDALNNAQNTFEIQ
jgi:hypothetical protein